MMLGSGTMGWYWGFGVLVLVGISILIYVVIRLLSKNRGRKFSSTSPSTVPDLSSAQKILDERFARGDITSKQYREQVRVLGGGQ